MKALLEERVVYLVGLIATLFIIISLVGMPSLIGVSALALALVFAWRLGVLIDPYIMHVPPRRGAVVTGRPTPEQ